MKRRFNGLSIFDFRSGKRNEIIEWKCCKQSEVIEEDGS
jgi:hypothetical protein